MHPFSIPSKTQPSATQCSTVTASACPSLRYYNFNRELDGRVCSFLSFVLRLCGCWLDRSIVWFFAFFIWFNLWLSYINLLVFFIVLPKEKKDSFVLCPLVSFKDCSLDGSIWPPATNRCVSPMLFCVFLQILTVEVFRLRNKFHSNRQTRASSHNIPSLRIPVAMVIHVVVIFLFGAACSQLTTDFCKYTVGRLR